jgi:hypothetical protein
MLKILHLFLLIILNISIGRCLLTYNLKVLPLSLQRLQILSIPMPMIPQQFFELYLHKI